MGKLSSREKIFVVAGSAILVVFFLVYFVIRPLLNEHQHLQQDILKVQKDVGEFSQLKQEYLLLKQKSEQIDQQLKNRKKEFTLFSLLESLAQKIEIKDYIKYMKPSNKSISDKYKEVSVEIKLAGITSKQLTDYLYKIENSNMLARIKRLTIYPMRNNEGFLEVTLQVFTYELKGKKRGE